MKDSLTDIMEYLPTMEQIHSDMLEVVLRQRERYDPTSYTHADIKRAIAKDILTLDDYGALLSVCAMEHLEEIAVRAQSETRKHFGNSICLFTPLYISNYCENNCIYCGYNCRNRILRAKLTDQEIDNELRKIADTGLKEILILTGESRKMSDITYIGRALETAKKYFSTIGIEIYPLNTDEYAYLKEKGADFVSVYQETYNKEQYGLQHLSGSKRVFPYRFYSQERAVMGGMRGVYFGALLGLDDFRKDAYSAGVHAYLLQQKYPHAEVGFSVPRMRPYINNDQNNAKDVHERQLLQVMLAYRMLLPHAGITISTRENAHFRDHVIGLVATKISAGVCVGVGGHDGDEKGDEQFEISDDRTVEQVVAAIKHRGLQPVFSDTSFL